ncbi:MAG: sigma-70 family RNA polymerase sigma factor [bacterium]|nr:sigma-70 family RNA polymerase sigma factor [bacterium]
MLEKYYKETKKYIYNYISKYISNKEDVEDLISIIFTKFIAKYNLIKDKGENFVKNYLFKIVKTKLIDFFRINKKYQNYELIYNIKKMENIDLDEYVQNKLLIEKLLSKLDKEEIDILVLKIVDNLTFKEIANLKKSNINTIIWKFNRIIQKLQKIKDQEIKE